MSISLDSTAFCRFAARRPHEIRLPAATACRSKQARRKMGDEESIAKGSSIMTNTLQTKTLAAAIQERRSIRKLSHSPAISREKVEEIVQLALNAPSAFNMQSGRVVVLMGENHEKLWDIVKETLRPLVPADAFGDTEARLEGFRNGAGTVLFFENQATVEKYQEMAPLYKDQFPGWSLQGSGMLQYAVWLSLSAQGLGASLQHYNPLIDEQVKQQWDIPGDWTLTAQIPFGRPEESPAKRTFLPYEEVVKWH